MESKNQELLAEIDRLKKETEELRLRRGTISNPHLLPNAETMGRTRAMEDPSRLNYPTSPSVMWEIITTKRRITTITDQFRRFIVWAATCGGMKAYCSCGHMTRPSRLRVVLWLVVKSPFDVFHINAVVLFVLCLQVSSTRIPRIPSWLFWTPPPQRWTSLM